MKITLLLNGKTDKAFVKDAIELYEGRLKKYMPFEIKVVPPPRKAQNLSPAEYMEKEARLTEKYLQPADYVILLDEKGKSMNSVKFAEYLQEKMNRGLKNLVVVVGGHYGFPKSLKQKAHGMVSLSPMTFSHQVIRVMFMEQLYRAMTILNNEPYHNE
ncbi:MAG: 23S rRNA (pseudouridine(1915)-N(3))-methyltransferase RlmH [Bacteroidales bacterium]|nr:23S rRNA (pseudouridine(1915)-N(3))-methyltransferase RlmH [Bacteroidales bacterium]